MDHDAKNTEFIHAPTQELCSGVFNFVLAYRTVKAQAKAEAEAKAKVKPKAKTKATLPDVKTCYEKCFQYVLYHANDEANTAEDLAAAHLKEEFPGTDTNAVRKAWIEQMADRQFVARLFMRRTAFAPLAHQQHILNKLDAKQPVWRLLNALPPGLGKTLVSLVIIENAFNAKKRQERLALIGVTGPSLTWQWVHAPYAHYKTYPTMHIVKSYNDRLTLEQGGVWVMSHAMLRKLFAYKNLNTSWLAFKPEGGGSFRPRDLMVFIDEVHMVASMNTEIVQAFRALDKATMEALGANTTSSNTDMTLTFDACLKTAGAELDAAHYEEWRKENDRRKTNKQPYVPSAEYADCVYAKAVNLQTKRVKSHRTVDDLKAALDTNLVFPVVVLMSATPVRNSLQNLMAEAALLAVPGGAFNALFSQARYFSAKDIDNYIHAQQRQFLAFDKAYASNRPLPPQPRDAEAIPEESIKATAPDYIVVGYGTGKRKEGEEGEAIGPGSMYSYNWQKEKWTKVNLEEYTDANTPVVAVQRTTGRQLLLSNTDDGWQWVIDNRTATLVEAHHTMWAFWQQPFIHLAYLELYDLFYGAADLAISKGMVDEQRLPQTGPVKVVCCVPDQATIELLNRFARVRTEEEREMHSDKKAAVDEAARKVRAKLDEMERKLIEAQYAQEDKAEQDEGNDGDEDDNAAAEASAIAEALEPDEADVENALQHEEKEYLTDGKVKAPMRRKKVVSREDRMKALTTEISALAQLINKDVSGGVLSEFITKKRTEKLRALRSKLWRYENPVPKAVDFLVCQYLKRADVTNAKGKAKSYREAVGLNEAQWSQLDTLDGFLKLCTNETTEDGVVPNDDDGDTRDGFLVEGRKLCSVIKFQFGLQYVLDGLLSDDASMRHVLMYVSFADTYVFAVQHELEIKRQVDRIASEQDQPGLNSASQAWLGWRDRIEHNLLLHNVGVNAAVVQVLSHVLERRKLARTLNRAQHTAPFEGEHSDVWNKLDSDVIFWTDQPNLRKDVFPQRAYVVASEQNLVFSLSWDDHQQRFNVSYASPAVVMTYVNRLGMRVVYETGANDTVFSVAPARPERCSYRLLTGDTKPADRDRIRNDFNEGIVPLVVMTDAGVAGVDFQGVDTIVEVDRPWNPSHETQLFGRGIRIMPRVLDKRPHVNRVVMVLSDPQDFHNRSRARKMDDADQQDLDTNKNHQEVLAIAADEEKDDGDDGDYDPDVSHEEGGIIRVAAEHEASPCHCAQDTNGHVLAPNAWRTYHESEWRCAVQLGNKAVAPLGFTLTTLEGVAVGLWQQPKPVPSQVVDPRELYHYCPHCHVGFPFTLSGRADMRKHVLKDVEHQENRAFWVKQVKQEAVQFDVSVHWVVATGWRCAHCRGTVDAGSTAYLYKFAAAVVCMACIQRLLPDDRAVDDKGNTKPHHKSFHLGQPPTHPLKHLQLVSGSLADERLKFWEQRTRFALTHVPPLQLSCDVCLQPLHGPWAKCTLCPSQHHETCANQHRQAQHKSAVERNEQTTVMQVQRCDHCRKDFAANEAVYICNGKGMNDPCAYGETPLVVDSKCKTKYKDDTHRFAIESKAPCCTTCGSSFDEAVKGTNTSLAWTWVSLNDPRQRWCMRCGYNGHTARSGNAVIQRFRGEASLHALLESHVDYVEDVMAYRAELAELATMATRMWQAVDTRNSENLSSRSSLYANLVNADAPVTVAWLQKKWAARENDQPTFAWMSS